MKQQKTGLRIWIASVAVTGFLAGWGMFAHSGKPASLFNLPSISAAAQAQSLQQSNAASSSSGIQSLPQLPPASYLPRLRTGGS